MRPQLNRVSVNQPISSASSGNVAKGLGDNLPDFFPPPSSTPTSSVGGERGRILSAAENDRVSHLRLHTARA